MSRREKCIAVLQRSRRHLPLLLYVYAFVSNEVKSFTFNYRDIRQILCNWKRGGKAELDLLKDNGIDFVQNEQKGEEWIF